MGALEAIKTLGTRLVDIHDAELKSQLQQMVIEAQGEVLGLQEKVASQRDEIENLKRELQEVRDKTDLLAEVRFEHNAYWVPSDSEPKAYCVGCVHSRAQLLPLARHGRGSAGAYCPVCNTKYREVYGTDPGLPKVPPHPSNRREGMLNW